MKKVLLSLAAVSAIAAAATPAAAAHNDRNVVSAHRLINQREAQLAQRIDRAIHRGQISRFEARALVNELRRIEVLEHRYGRNGLSRAEFADLNIRLDRLQAMLRHERRDDDRRYGYGYGYGTRW